MEESKNEGESVQIALAGTLQKMAATRGEVSADAIVVERLVPVSVSEVWRLWTTKEGFESWLVDEANVELRIGGPIELCFLPEQAPGRRGSEGCVFLVVVPKRLLVFTWNAPPEMPLQREERTFVVVELQATQTGTFVRVTHAGWPGGDALAKGEWRDTFEYFRRAWAGLMDELVAHCSRA